MHMHSGYKLNACAFLSICNDILESIRQIAISIFMKISQYKIKSSDGEEFKVEQKTIERSMHYKCNW